MILGLRTIDPHTPAILDHHPQIRSFESWGCRRNSFWTRSLQAASCHMLPPMKLENAIKRFSSRNMIFPNWSLSSIIFAIHNWLPPHALTATFLFPSLWWFFVTSDAYLSSEFKLIWCKWNLAGNSKLKILNSTKSKQNSCRKNGLSYFTGTVKLHFQNLS